MNATAVRSVATESTDPPELDHGEDPILVVDDSALFRRLAGGLIRGGLGRRVIYADDGFEALKLLEAVEPCLVLTDIQMPRMDGFEVVKAIRADHPQIPVVLMTAFGSETVAMRALSAGAASYVPKDFLVSHLVGTLQQLLNVVEVNRRRRQLMSCQTSRAGSFKLSNDPDLIPELAALIQEELLLFSIGDQTARMRVAIAIQESLANALYHGNLECSTDLRQEDERHFYRLADDRRSVEPYRSRRIYLEMRIDRQEARVEIRDEGPGFDVASLDKPFDPEDLMRVGGRGMILIRSFFDEVTHNELGNQITLIKRK